MLSVGKRVPFTMLVMMLFIMVGAVVPAAAQSGEVVTNQDGDVETVDGVEYTHRFVEVDGLTWHYVEAGEGEPVVFLHGMPESWYTWHYQMAGLATDYHVIAIDLKGYGQSDKADGDYSAAAVAEEIVALLDAIGLEKFAMVARDQGANVADYIGMNHPDRITGYVRIDTTLRVFGAFPGRQGGAIPGGEGGAFPGGEDGTPRAPAPGTQPGAGDGVATPPAPGDVPGAGEAPNPEWMVERMSQQMQDADTFVRSTLARQTVQEIPEADIARLVAEHSRDGVAEAAPRYYRDMMFAFGANAAEEGANERRLVDYTVMDFPVLLLQGDFAQQQGVDEEQLGNAIAQFPDAVFYWVIDAGGFSHLEQPEVVTAGIRAFLEASGE